MCSPTTDRAKRQTDRQTDRQTEGPRVVFSVYLHAAPFSPGLGSPDPWEREPQRGNPRPHDVILRGALDYRQSVRKCTKPKINITQLLGLIVFTVEQLGWIKEGPLIKYGYKCTVASSNSLNQAYYCLGEKRRSAGGERKNREILFLTVNFAYILVK